jgi:hypothetical protein
MSERPTPLDFLQAVYLDATHPLNVRLRAAIEAAPYMHPKLSAAAVGHFNKEDFATLLDRAVQRSMKVIEGRVIQIEGQGQIGIEEER